MALEGTLDTGIKSNSGSKGIKFYWYVKSQSGLTSYCHYTLYSYGDSGYTMCRNVVLKINGNDVGISTAEFKAYDGTVIDEGDFEIYHNSSTGAASFTVSITAAMFTYADNLSASTTFYPNTISVDTYAASTISSASNVTLGNACSVSWTPAVSSMGYKLIFSIGSYSKTISGIAPNRTSAYTYTGFTIPLDVANYISSSSKTGTMTVKLYSYKETSCTTQVGSYSSKTFTVTIPDSSNTRPSISMSLSAVNDLSSPFDSIYLQGKTKVQATFTDSAKYGASVSLRSITINNATDRDSPYQLLLTLSGNVTVKGTVKDSRGFTNSTEEIITVIQYGSPAVIPYSTEKNVVCDRCNEDGIISSTGTHLRIKAGRKYSPVTIGNEQKNFCSLGYRYAASGSEMPSTFTSLLSKTDVSTDYVDVTLTEIELSVKNSYVVEIQAIDDVGDSHVMSFVIGTDSVTMHMKAGGRGVAFGKYAEQDDLLDVEWDTAISGDLYLGIIRKKLSDFVIEEGSTTADSAIWQYRKWRNGRIEMWSRQTVVSGAFNGSNGVYYSNVITLPIPFNIKSDKAVAHVSIHSSGVTFAATVATWTSELRFCVGRLFGGTDSLPMETQIYITGFLD